MASTNQVNTVTTENVVPVGATYDANGNFITLVGAAGAPINTLSGGGMANGVAYLNGSKVLTTGSALTFDGTNLGIGTSSPATKLDVVDAANFAPIRLTGAAGTTVRFDTTRNFTVNRNWIIGCDYVSEGGFALIPSTALGGGTFLNPVYQVSAVGVHTWASGASERMRLDSSGNLGIGTSSPNASAILDAQSTTKGVRMPNMTTTQKNAIASPAAGLMVFDTTLAKLCVYSGSAWQTITSV
jgi:hypothetical protein